MPHRTKAALVILVLMCAAASVFASSESHPTATTDAAGRPLAAGTLENAPRSTDYDPAPYSAAVARLVETLDRADVETALDRLLAPPTRFALTPDCRDLGEGLAEHLRDLGYSVEEDEFLTALGLQSLDHNGAFCCVVGAAGLIYTSTDGGASWTRRDDGSRPKTLNEVAVATDDARLLSAGGAGNLLLGSRDGGLTWSDVETPLAEEGSITGLQRPGGETVYLTSWSSSGSSFLRSTDDGDTWTIHDPGFGPQPYAILGLEFIDANNGWACGYRVSGQSDIGCVARTTDGGFSWQVWSTTGRIFVNTSFADTLHGYAVCNDREAIYRTDDGGASWELCHEFNDPDDAELYEYLGDVEALSADHAVAVGYAGVVLETVDGGDSWSYLREPSADPDFDNRIALSVLDDDRWLAAGDGALESTTDGGLTWTDLLPTLGLPPAVNVFAYRTGSSGEEGPLLIAAYDTTSEDPWFDAPGADANGSGAAALLMAAEALAGIEPERSLGFLFTSSRYLPGGFGRSAAERFIATHSDYVPRCALNPEAVGYTSDSALDLYLLGNAPDEELMNAVAGYATDYVPGLDIYLEYNFFPVYDIGPFMEAGIPGAYCSEYYLEIDDANYRRGTIEDTRDSLNPTLVLLSARLATAYAAAEAGLGGELPTVPISPYVYPNPFRPASSHTELTFAGLPPAGEVRVYSIDGELLHSGFADEGPFIENGTPTWRHTWDAANDHGEPLASGVYLYRVEGPDGYALGRLAIIR